ncbi:DUF4270 family protein [Aquimarina sp. AD1]|uniref:DUF4270 family protein n=1 Tax=Aquimarina sp. (strain AD1) TaxID=1714848 RepID=UPI000E557A3C|nr:DUF4270 family protein [Aquimarina sp. AD1]AXT58104.1 DUF4270 family protein [Aquimarina sp. AD1]RKN37258.1 DUF4270 family protein [Aquimarina sp. AD1]
MRELFGLLIIILSIISCSDREEDIPTLEVGQDFTDSNIRIISIDTFAVELSTFKFDSINSSSNNRLLLGQYKDEFFGTVRASNYFELTSLNYNLPDDAELDSIALVLGYDRYFYSDTTNVAQVNIHVLTDEVDPEEDFFYNTSVLPYETIPIATRNYIPEPFDEDSLHISLPIAFGQTLFDLIRDGDINDDDELRRNFKGFTLQPRDEDDASIIGFSKSSESTYLRFFYTVPGEFEDDEEAFDLTINSATITPKSFNNIISNVADTFLEPLIDQEINLLSKDSENRSYIQAGTGYATRIQFPTIRKIYDIPGTGTILNATLQIKPPPQAFSNALPIRDSLFVDIADQNNELIDRLFNGQGGVFALINEENIEFNEVIYEIPIGFYLEQELQEAPIIDNALVLFSQDFNQTVDRFVLEGESSTDFRARLILTYAIYDE